MSATRHGIMSLRFAKTLEARSYFNRDVVYPNLGYA
jgi:hypothetical protein